MTLTKRGLAALACGAAFLLGAGTAAATLISIDISGNPTGGSAAPNVLFQVDLAAGLGLASGSEVAVDGLGWEVTIQANSPSWLSEANIGLQDSSGNGLLAVAPGAGDDMSGTVSYSSGGIIDLVGLGLDFSLADGVMQVELFESFNDGLIDPDGFWLANSSFTVNAIDPNAVAEPATLALLALGLIGFAATFRRRN